MTDKLRECPFCGGENVGVFEHKYFYKSYLYTVNCFDCHFGLKLVETEEEAIEAWNTRRPMDRIVDQLEEEIKQLPHIQHWPDWKKCYTKAIAIVKGAQNE